MYDVSAVPDRCLHLCMINVHVCMFKHSVLAILWNNMFMGLLAAVLVKLGRVLYAGRGMGTWQKAVLLDAPP